MRENLEPSLVFMLNDEGGFALRPPDEHGRGGEPGGAVNMGISMLVFSEWRMKHGKPSPTIDDLRNLTKDEAKEIYTDRWNRLGGDGIPTPLDYAVFDASTMLGLAGSSALLNLTLGTRVIPGHYDGETAWEGKNIEAMTNMFLLHLANKKMHSASVGKYGVGWGDRIVRVANRAREMMK